MAARTVGLLLWLVVGGLAALALFWQIKNPPPPPTVRAAPPPELPAVTPLERFRLPPPGRYSEVATRPLFIAERRPEPPPPPDEDKRPEPPPPPPGPEQKFMLFGVMIAPGVQAALVRLVEPSAKTVRVGPGEMIGEWRLDTVFPDRVVLRKGDATQELPLTRPRKPAKPRAKRSEAAQPGQSAAAPPANGAPVDPAIAPAPPANPPEEPSPAAAM